MMKKIFRLRNIVITGILAVVLGFLAFLWVDAFFNRNFRTTQDPITAQVDLRGLRELNASGGAAVHFPDLQRRLSHVKGPILILDGMTEYHGYIYGIPTTFLAYQAIKRYNWKYKIRRFLLTGTKEIRKDLVIPEREMVLSQGFSYINLQPGSRFIPTADKIDEIIHIFENLPANTWIHFHCHHGKGRTSMMLVMFDILKNAPQVSLEDIVKRQHLLGSENLLDTTLWARGTYTQDQLNERRDFITQFYHFICQRKAGGPQLWSEWKKEG
jgi:predicted protein tyrosine phosphatase